MSVEIGVQFREFDALDKLEVAGLLAHAQWENGCLIWTGSRLRGYGKHSFKGKRVMAHRIAYEIVVGPIPNGLTLDHLCRTRPCIWPFHMEPVTNRVNILRGVGLSAVNATKTHCKRGHPFDEENTHLFKTRWGTVGRACKACQRDWHRQNGHRYYARQNARRRQKAQLQRAAGSQGGNPLLATGQLVTRSVGSTERIID